MTDRDDDLEVFFSANRVQMPETPDALLKRIEADALASIKASVPPAPQPRVGLWQDIMAALGGWRTGAGLGSAAVAGLMMGLFLPDTFAGLGSALTGEIVFDETTLAPSYGTAWLDGVEG